MKDSARLKVKGIKCDTPECDFNDTTVEYKDYPQWLNKPCPKCGANLLTQADYDNVQKLFETIELLNMMLPQSEDDTKFIPLVSVEMNGTGEMDFKEHDFLQEDEDETQR